MKRVIFSILDVCLFITVFILYLSCASYESSFEAFFKSQVQDFAFNTSLFDVLIFCFVRTILTLAILKIATFPVLMLILGISAAFFIVKCFLFDFAKDRTLEYTTMIVGFTTCALEVIIWTCIFPTFRKQKNPRIQHDKPLSVNFSPNDEQRSLLNEYNDSDFYSAEELDDNEERLTIPTELGTHEYTEDEKDILAVLRDRYPMFRDDKIYKFMVARDLDMKRIEEMLTKHVAWRERVHADTMALTHSPIPVRGFMCHKDSNGEEGDPLINQVFHYNGTVIHKFAKNGEPLVFFRAGWSDAKSVINNCTLETVEKTAVFVAEFILRVLCAESEKNKGYQISRISVVVDLSSLGLRQLHIPALTYFNHMIQISEDNYPETSGTIFIINAPSIFQAFWRFVKPVIPPNTMKKIHFLGANYTKTLLEFIDAENLPACFGGLCNCRIHGGCVPFPVSEGYTDPNLTEDGFTIKKLNAQEVCNIPMAIRKQDIEQFLIRTQNEMTVNYSFKTKEGTEIEFSLFFQDNFHPEFKAENTLTILANRSNSFQGTFNVSNPGTFWFSFKNPSTSKTVLNYKFI